MRPTKLHSTVKHVLKGKKNPYVKGRGPGKMAIIEDDKTAYSIKQSIADSFKDWAIRTYFKISKSKEYLQ